MNRFYARPWGTCLCGKPATHLILGPHNEEYDRCCARCAPGRAQQLDRTRGEPLEPLPPTQTR